MKLWGEIVSGVGPGLGYDEQLAGSCAEVGWTGKDFFARPSVPLRLHGTIVTFLKLGEFVLLTCVLAKEHIHEFGYDQTSNPIHVCLGGGGV